MFEIFTHGFTFLNFLSILAFITTVGLFFCGIPICRQIWKRQDTTEISGAPFLMGILGGCCWMTYGYLKGDSTVLYVTGCQVILYTSYTIFYWFMTKKKLWITIKVLSVVSLCAVLILSAHFFGMKVFHPLGIVCMTLNTADFAAPLAGLRVVMRRGATSTLPLPLCIANFLVSSEWFLYGLLVKDFYLITPNGIGSVLALFQLFLFVILPRKPGQKSLLSKMFYCLKSDKGSDLEDPTQDIVADLGVDDEKKLNRAQRWSQKVISNVSTVAEELENVIHMVGHDQFAYTHKINNEYDTASEKTVETLDDDKRKLSNVPEARDADSQTDNEIVTSGTEKKRYADETTAEKQLHRLRSMRINSSDTQANQLRRSISSPHLT